MLRLVQPKQGHHRTYASVLGETAVGYRSLFALFIFRSYVTPSPTDGFPSLLDSACVGLALGVPFYVLGGNRDVTTALRCVVWLYECDWRW